MAWALEGKTKINQTERPLIAKCKLEAPTSDQIADLQIDLSGSSKPYMIEVGRTYLILGLEYSNSPSLLGTAGAFSYTQNGYLFAAPIAMFDIIDPKVS